MSLAQPGRSDQPSPGLSTNLSSNNPFRNRAASPNFSNGQRSPLDIPPRPVSRNPFLDSSQLETYSSPPLTSPNKMSSSATEKAPPGTVVTSNAEQLFNELNLNDKPLPAPNGSMQPPPSRSQASEGFNQRRENVPPRGPPGHRPSRSQEEAMRARRMNGGSITNRGPRPAGELNIFADPVEQSSTRRPSERRPRRNSETSVRDQKTGFLDPEDEKRRQERKRRERRHRERDSKDKDGKPRKPDRKLDVIDKLDVTSIYGTGLFHHDGPFDACNPHRNRTGSKRAPMQAFPQDSLNNALGGGGPLNKRPDHATFMGHSNEEGFKDYSKAGNGSNEYEPYGNSAVRPGTSNPESNIQSATTRVEPVHGDESLGLGTSTFLEGAPASRTAIQRKESETATTGEGLGRKKSLAQRIRGVNRSRDYGPSGRVTNPEGAYSPEARTPGGTRVETNPFFNEFTKGEDSITAVRKEPAITIAEPAGHRGGRARAPSSPGTYGRPLERRATNDDMPPSSHKNNSSTGGGFLARVKSLKGPRKQKQPEA